jgi:hypothetical protein
VNALCEDYAGPFDPGFRIDHLSRGALARLAREFQLVGHVTDRVLMPIVGSRFGPEAMNALAIDEWMGASPVYSARNRALLGIEGDGVPAIFKGFQLDVGAPHQYMDFHFEVEDERRGFFWLPFCGAYADVKAAAGDDPKPVIGMCHHMEDPTFDATVMAVNPRARCRPVHRPPLPPDHEGPVCRWEVRISDDAGEFEEREITRTIRTTRAARFPIPPLRARGTGGLDDYAGPFRPDLCFEDFSQPALVRICQEAALDVNLLVRAAHLALEWRYGAAVRREIARDHWAGAVPVYARRIRTALGIAGDDVASILKTVQLDPALPAGYVKLGTALESPERGFVWIDPCEALDDDDPRGWISALDDEQGPAFEPLAAAVNPRARCRRIATSALPRAGAKAARAWELVIDRRAEPREESRWARVARISTVARFPFQDRAASRD